MNLRQMMLVLLVAICFSTLMISYYSGMSLQAQQAEMNVYQSQGLKIVNHIFQTYETRLLAEDITFDELYALLGKPGGLDLPPHQIEGIAYYPNVSSRYTDVNGNIVSGDSDYQRLDIVIRVDINTREFYVGSPDAPFSKVFSI